jgi:two-component system, NtrC family, response regulator AtoC
MKTLRVASKELWVPPIGFARKQPPMEVASENIEPVSEDIFFVAASPLMRKLFNHVGLLAQVNAPLLIVGEAGTGKQTTARLTHKLSARSRFKFLKFNCASTSEDLLRALLFVPEPGGPRERRSRAGRFEACERGTLLLVEIAELPFGVQASLLRALRNQQIVSMGAQIPTRADVRVMATSSVDLEQAVAEKRLIEDLYYELSAFTIHVPPLRQRRQDIPLLLEHFMRQASTDDSLMTRTFSPALCEACQRYPWPGNLPELRTFVKRYLVTGDEKAAIAELERGLEPIPVSLLTQLGGKHPGGNGATRAKFSGFKSLVRTIKGQAEKSLIASALDQTKWNRRAAAGILRVSYRSLLYKIEEYQLQPRSHFSPPN